MNKPGGFTAYCVFAIAFGTLGLLGSMTAAASTLVGEKFQEAVSKMQPSMPNNPMQDAMDQMQKESNEIAARYRWLTLSLAGVNFILSALLLAGGIMTYRLQPAGRSLLLSVFIIAAVYEAIAIVPAMMMQREMFTVQERYMGRIVQAPAGPGGKAMPQPASGFLSTWMQIVGTATIVFAVGWTLAKVAAYVSGFFYLRIPKIRALFAVEPAFAASAPLEVQDFDDLGQWDDKQP